MSENRSGTRPPADTPRRRGARPGVQSGDGVQAEPDTVDTGEFVYVKHWSRLISIFRYD